MGKEERRFRRSSLACYDAGESSVFAALPGSSRVREPSCSTSGAAPSRIHASVTVTLEMVGSESHT